MIQSSAYAIHKTGPKTLERPNIMDHKNLIPSNWIHVIRENITTTKGKFLAQNNSGKNIILEWVKVEPISPEFNEHIKTLSDILIKTYTKQELDFAKKYPEAIPQEHFLKSLEPLFKDGLEKLDWELAEYKLKSIFKEFFTETNLTKYSNPEDIQLFVIAKDKITDEILGCIQYIVTTQDAYGSIKVGMVGIKDTFSNNGIQLLLMSSLFKLIPNVTRMYLHTRITNESALNLYESWGFSPFTGPLPYWQDMEYLADTSNILQNIAAKMR